MIGDTPATRIRRLAREAERVPATGGRVAALRARLTLLAERCDEALGSRSHARAELLEHVARTELARAEVEALEQERRRVRVGELEARWTAAGGSGPPPGLHAFGKACDRGDAEAAARAMAVARRAVAHREAAHADPVRTEDQEHPASAVAPGAGVIRADGAGSYTHGRPALRLLLDDLEGSGRPVPVLLPAERALLEQAAGDGDPAGIEKVLSRIRARARAEADRLRLLFDLERLGPLLPDGLAAELSAAAAETGADETVPEQIRHLRERLLDAL